MAEEPVGIENPSKLDLVSTSPDESTVLLHIVQAQEWDGSTRLLPPLHEKCKNYVAFACDGQLARMYPEYALLPWQRLSVRTGRKNPGAPPEGGRGNQEGGWSGRSSPPLGAQLGHPQGDGRAWSGQPRDAPQANRHGSSDPWGGPPRAEHAYASADAGSGFQPVASPVPIQSSEAIATPAPGTIVIADSGLVSTFDGGRTWKTDPTVASNNEIPKDLGFTSPDQGVVVLANRLGRDSGTLFIIFDGGHTWKPVTMSFR